MAKMKATLYMGNKSVALKDVDIPEVGSCEVLVKIKYCAMCGTDVHTVKHELFHRAPGFGLGHECSGVIEKIGEGVDKYGFKVGDKVVAGVLVFCGTCKYCKLGMTQYCENKNSHRFAGYAEYAVCSVNQIYKLPDDADLKKYCLVDPMACAMRGLEIGDIKMGQNVAISGVGGIGMILLNLILLNGSANVTVIEPSENKRKLALKMGAQYALNPFTDDVVTSTEEITNGMGFGVVFEASGAPSAAKTALDIMGYCSKIVYFACYPETFELPVNLFKLYLKEGSIHTAYLSNDMYARSINLMPRMSMEYVIGETTSLANIEQAFEDFEKSEYPKTIIDCTLS